MTNKLTVIAISVFSLSPTISVAQDNLSTEEIIDALMLPEVPLTRSFSAKPDPFKVLKTRGIRVDEPIPNEVKTLMNKVQMTIEFEFNSAQLTANGKKELDKLAFSLGSEHFADSIFQIGGHTDAQGSEIYNYNLGQMRAGAVVTYLSSAYGISSGKLLAVSYGESDPIDKLNPESGSNRRVEIINVTPGS